MSAHSQQHLWYQGMKPLKPGKPPRPHRCHRSRRRRSRFRRRITIAGIGIIAAAALALALIANWPEQSGTSRVVALQEKEATPTYTALTAPTVKPTSAPEPRYAGGAPLLLPDIEVIVIELTNGQRELHGLPELAHDPAISGIARAHSDNMVRTGEFSHHIAGQDPTDRALAAGYDCKAWEGDSYTYGLSENISYRPRTTKYQIHRTLAGDPRHTPTKYHKGARSMAQSIVEGWMDSPGHRANILDPQARRIGVGLAVLEDDQYGYTDEVVYATQNFSACQ